MYGSLHHSQRPTGRSLEDAKDEDELGPLLQNSSIFQSSDDIAFMSNPMRKVSNKSLPTYKTQPDVHEIRQEDLYPQEDISFVNNPFVEVYPRRVGQTIDEASLLKLDEEVQATVGNKLATKYSKTQFIISPKGAYDSTDATLLYEVYRDSSITQYLGHRQFRLYGLLVIFFVIAVSVMYSIKY